MPKLPTMPSAHNRSSSNKLHRSDSGSGAGILTLALVTLSLILFTIGVREGGVGILSSMRVATQTIVSPLRLAGAGIVSPFMGIGNVFRNLTADEKTLSEMKEEIERLSARNVELEEAAVTAKELQTLLDLRNTYNLQSIAAHVIAGSTDSWTSTITIDKGLAAGLTVGMPVVDGSGAVGQLIDCAASTSTVRLLSDENSSVSAMIQSSRAQGMLRGSPDGTLYLSFIRTDQTVDVGDIVVTSGLGGVFPKGLPLGKIASVESTPGSTYYTIVIEPFSQAVNLEEVMVITSLTEGQEATAEDIEEADAADLAAASGRSASLGNNRDDEDEDDEEQGEDEFEDETAVKTDGTGSSKTNTNASVRTNSNASSLDSEEYDEEAAYVSPHAVGGGV